MAGKTRQKSPSRGGRRTASSGPRRGASTARAKTSATKAKTLAGSPFSRLLMGLKPDVDQRLTANLDAELTTRGPLGPEVEAILREAKALSLRGGKRLRAALVVAGLRALGGASGKTWGKRQWDEVLDVCVAVELLQSYFLIHDDWMDQDAERRGGPSVHHALESQFDSSHRAACGAVLAGDYLVALASRTLTQSCRKHPHLDALLERFAEMQLSAVLGQKLDVIGQCRDAELIYRFKTSSYTVSGPLELGALLGGATPKRAARVREFADAVGVAFQLRDDLLSAFGDPKQTGKPFASDLRSGKWTWVVQYAMENGSAAERRQLSACFGKPRAKVSQLKQGVAALESSGARQATEQRIHQLSEQATAALNRLKLGREGRALLSSAANALIDRRM